MVDGSKEHVFWSQAAMVQIPVPPLLFASSVKSGW